MPENQGSDGSSTRATEVKKFFIHARKSASFGGMYLVIRHHLANGFRRPCVFSCQMAIDSHQTTIDSYQTTIDSHQTTMDSHQTTIDSYQTTMDSYQTTIDRRQVNRTAGECSRARRIGRISHKVGHGAPCPYALSAGSG